MLTGTPYLKGKWCGISLPALLPHGLTGQSRFQNWLKKEDFFCLHAFQYKVLYIRKNNCYVR